MTSLQKLHETVKPGDLLTVKEPIEASYSRYAGNPECWLTPGILTCVVSVQVPCVTQPFDMKLRAPYGEFINVEWNYKMRENPYRLVPQSRAAVHYNNIALHLSHIDNGFYLLPLAKAKEICTPYGLPHVGYERSIDICGQSCYVTRTMVSGKQVWAVYSPTVA